MRSGLSAEDKLIAEFFEFIVKSTLEGAVATKDLVEEKVEQELNKAKARSRLDILEYQEDAKNKRSFYTPNEDEENRIVDTIKLKDPDFNKELFEKFAIDIFSKFYKAYCENNLDSVRKFVDINVVEKFNLQANQNATLNLKETIEILEFNYVDIFGYHKEGNAEIISVALSLVFRDCIKDEQGTIVAGSEKAKQRGVYILSFARKIGGKTINSIKDYLENGILHCTNCGSEIVNSFSQCEHCGTTLFNSTENWLMNHIERL